MIKEKNEFVKRSTNTFSQIDRDFIKICPNCKSNKIFVRNRKKPKYRCHNCGNEFDNPEAMIDKKTAKQKKEHGQQYNNPNE